MSSTLMLLRTLRNMSAGQAHGTFKLRFASFESSVKTGLVLLDDDDPVLHPGDFRLLQS